MIRVMLALAATVAAAAVLSGGAGAASNAGSGCIAHRPAYVDGVFEPAYTAGCSAHDEPELDPISCAAGSAQDLTWTFRLPTDGLLPVSAVGPTFWFGGTVTDPVSLFRYTVCSPVWSLTGTGQKPNFHEPAAFNAMLTTSGNKHEPMVMNAGDEIVLHFHLSSPGAGGTSTSMTRTRATPGRSS